jgi:hypothetical protein
MLLFELELNYFKKEFKLPKVKNLNKKIISSLIIILSILLKECYA